jgi:hypothetical protein
MAKPTISSYVKEHGDQPGKKKQPGPFITVSRQFGCDGYAAAEQIAQNLSNMEDEPKWEVLYKEFINQLSEDTGLSVEQIEKERLSPPSLVKDIVRGFKKSGIPDAFEIRNKLSVMIRERVFTGHVIILGNGGAAATYGLEKGLNIRIEAPLEWRIPRVSRMENITKDAAVKKIEEIETHRQKLMKFYKDKNPKYSSFDLVLDNSTFSIEQMAEIVLLALKQKELLQLEKK